MMREGVAFAVFILTHGRPDNVHTLKTLRDCGYTGRVFFIVDDLDSTVSEYQKLYGTENVIIFDKVKAAKTCDTADPSGDLRAVVFARNASFAIAKKLGLTHFLQLDDDYTSFEYRYRQGLKLKVIRATDLDAIFASTIDFLEVTKAHTVAFGQGGDWIGGALSNMAKRPLRRKAMNSFFFSVNRPVEFVGLLNEDVNAYLLHGSRGDLLFTVTNMIIVQKQTQKQQHGLTDLYLKVGTYTKSFYSVIVAPSCVKIALMGDTHERIHHQITWNNAVPKIINQRYRV